MIAARTATWLLISAGHITVIVRTVLLEGREPYSRAAWLSLLIALPGIGTMLNLLFGEPWVSPTFRKRSRDAYRVLFADVAEVAPDPVRSMGSANTFRTCAAAACWPAAAGNGGLVAPEGDGATDMIIADIFAAVLAAARTRIVVTTPYFAPDPPLLAAIIAAARRGVELTIIFPRRNDNRIVGAIGRAYYPILTKAGVRIFGYASGLLHAKTLVADGRLALVGSSNMDRRSLDLDSENNILFESEKLARDVGKRQRRRLVDAFEVNHDGVAARSQPRRFVDNLLTMAAPLF